MSPRFGTLTPAAALERLQLLLDDIAWSAAQDAQLPNGDADAAQLDRLAERLQQVVDIYTTQADEGQRQQALEEEDTARWWHHWQAEDAARDAAEKRWAGET